MFFHVWWKNIFWSKNIFPLFFHVFPTFSIFFPSKTLLFLQKNLKSEKNILFQFFIHVTVFSKMFPHLIWHFQSYLGRKKGTSETFLSLGLFISQPPPTASASKTFPQFPFFYLGNFGKTEIRCGKSYFRCDMEKNQNKILFLHIQCYSRYWEV